MTTNNALEVRLNDEFVITCPEGFRLMSEEEKAGLRFIENGEGVCLEDKGRHIVASIAWKTSGFAALFANPKAAVKSMEPRTRKPMEAFGYQLEGFTEREIAGLPAHGFQFRYEASGTAMRGSSTVMKSGKTFYYLHFYWRDELHEASSAVIDEMMNSIRK